MAGRLETNLEEELKKELVKPEFMSKPDSEWTEEEQKAAKEFEKKEQKVVILYLCISVDFVVILPAFLG